MYASKEFLINKRRTANIQNILQLCQDQSIMLPRATAEKKY